MGVAAGSGKDDLDFNKADDDPSRYIFLGQQVALCKFSIKDW